MTGVSLPDQSRDATSPARHAISSPPITECRIWVKGALLIVCRRLPVHPDKRTYQQRPPLRKNATSRLMQRNSLFDDLIGAGEQHWRYGKAKPFGGLEVDHEPVDRRLLKWQIARFLAAQNAVHVTSGLAIQFQ